MRSSNPWWRVVAALFAAVLLLSACDGGDGGDQQTEAGGDGGNGEAAAECEEGGGGDSTVELGAENLEFTEDELTAPAGATVTVSFDNGDSAPHTFTTASPPGCDTGTVEAGAAAEVTLTMPEEPVDFFCSIHPAMKGQLVPE